ncbi:hypothetical protein FVEG_14072 [Fusarium verticillioides 7600]|uniref:Uncharacterized protein n=1 Tax=Gibberella moniliformis (strain M3125 / FGSC 7600) TaxID=334819 RepID=W7N895_GIBM7|nr:hypothetical protein FVEG_14072 [Fusarium verticillioides 7600]EWG55969.1 hypothetical protein FVEG_14072 [Fusarium verticillioides 7600]
MAPTNKLEPEKALKPRSPDVQSSAQAEPGGIMAIDHVKALQDRVRDLELQSQVCQLHRSPKSSGSQSQSDPVTTLTQRPSGHGKPRDEPTLEEKAPVQQREDPSLIEVVWFFPPLL